MNIAAAQTPKSFRFCAIMFSLFLLLAAAWLISAEFLRASVPFFPTPSEVQDVTAQRNSAAAAARIGWLRGDLWADNAIIADSEVLNNSSSPQSDYRPAAKLEAALAAAPYDSRLWLLLSAQNAQLGWTNPKTLAQLKMSYYTAPNDVRLFPARLTISMQPQAIDDEELRTLLSYEVRTIIAHRAELKPLLAKAYRETSPKGRQFIEDQIAGQDGAFLAELRATTH